MASRSRATASNTDDTRLRAAGPHLGQRRQLVDGLQDGRPQQRADGPDVRLGERPLGLGRIRTWIRRPSTTTASGSSSATTTPATAAAAPRRSTRSASSSPTAPSTTGTANGPLSDAVCDKADFNFVIDMSGSIGVQGSAPSNLPDLQAGISAFVASFQAAGGDGIYSGTRFNGSSASAMTAGYDSAADFVADVQALSEPVRHDPDRRRHHHRRRQQRGRPRRCPQHHVRRHRRLAQRARTAASPPATRTPGSPRRTPRSTRPMRPVASYVVKAVYLATPGRPGRHRTALLAGRRRPVGGLGHDRDRRRLVPAGRLQQLRRRSSTRPSAARRRPPRSTSPRPRTRRASPSRVTTSSSPSPSTTSRPRPSRSTASSTTSTATSTTQGYLRQRRSPSTRARSTSAPSPGPSRATPATSTRTRSRPTIHNADGSASDSDDATVDVTDVEPTVQITKEAAPGSRPEPGGVFTYTLEITNTSPEDVVITALSDDKATLSAACLGLIGDTLTPGQIGRPASSPQRTRRSASTPTRRQRHRRSTTSSNEASDDDDGHGRGHRTSPRRVDPRQVGRRRRQARAGWRLHLHPQASPTRRRDRDDHGPDGRPRPQRRLPGPRRPVARAGRPRSAPTRSPSPTPGRTPNTAEVTVEDDEGTEASDDDDETGHRHRRPADRAAGQGRPRRRQPARAGWLVHLPADHHQHLDRGRHDRRA